MARATIVSVAGDARKGGITRAIRRGGKLKARTDLKLGRSAGACSPDDRRMTAEAGSGVGSTAAGAGA